jgi:hypothetical protein
MRVFHNVNPRFILTSSRFYLQCTLRQSKSPRRLMPLIVVGGRSSRCLRDFVQLEDVALDRGVTPRAPVNPCKRHFGY